MKIITILFISLYSLVSLGMDPWFSKSTSFSNGAVILPSFEDGFLPFLQKNTYYQGPQVRENKRKRTDNVEPQAPSFELIKQSNIYQVRKYLNKLRQSADIKSILVICDVDGTITNSPHPCDEPEFRGEANALLHENLLAGVQVLVCSAFNEPAVTMNTIQRLKLGSRLDIDKEPLQQGELKYKHRNFEWYKQGRVCSLRVQGEKFYRNKALAVLLAQRKSELFKQIIFIDDSLKNHKQFENDIQQLDLVTGTTVKAFLLCHPEKEPDFSPSDSEDDFNF